MTFGYLYDFRNPEQWRRPWTISMLRRWTSLPGREARVFEGAWVPEHHGAADGYAPSPLVVLAAIAARTKTIKLGSAIALAPLYHPVRFAEGVRGARHPVQRPARNGRRDRVSPARGGRPMARTSRHADRRTDDFSKSSAGSGGREKRSPSKASIQFEECVDCPCPSRGRIPLYLGGIYRQGDGAPRSMAMAMSAIWKFVTSTQRSWRACGKDPASARVRIQGLLCPCRQRSREGPCMRWRRIFTM